MITELKSREISQTVDHIAARWARPDKSILKQVFPLLASGQPLTEEQIIEVTGANHSNVREALSLGRTGRDEQGHVIELFGVTKTTTSHRIEINQTILYSCCALVAHMVPMLTGGTARIESTDPISKESVWVTIRDHTLESFTPMDATGTFVSTEFREVMDSVGDAFCNHIMHFSSIENAQEFIAQNPKRFILNMEEFHDIAIKMYEAIWT
ncbi:organomercurial lyase [Candidatus Neomarinimicrobiota bacterium]